MCAEGFLNVTLLLWYLISNFFFASFYPFYETTYNSKHPSKNQALKEDLKSSCIGTEKTYKKAGYDTEQTFGILAQFAASNKVQPSKKNKQ
jgi:hypothetical protein